MPTRDEHLERVKHNTALLSHLKQSEVYKEFSDWYVTIAFYVSAEYIEAMLFAVKPEIRSRMDIVTVVEHSRGHKDRNHTIRRCFEEVHDAYTTLYSYSRVAKYRHYIPVSGGSRSAEALLWSVKAYCEKTVKARSKIALK